MCVCVCVCVRAGVDSTSIILTFAIKDRCGRTLICGPRAQKQFKSLRYICSNSQKYTVWVKITKKNLCQKSLGYK